MSKSQIASNSKAKAKSPTNLGQGDGCHCRIGQEKFLRSQSEHEARCASPPQHPGIYPSATVERWHWSYCVRSALQICMDLSHCVCEALADYHYSTSHCRFTPVEYVWYSLDSSHLISSHCSRCNAMRYVSSNEYGLSGKDWLGTSDAIVP
jgi:hypothetical protein